MKKPGAYFLGLCGTCDNQATCTYPKVPRRPVMQCLEYEELAETAPPRRAPARSQRAQPGVDERSTGVRTGRGLCPDCELRETCTFPRLPGGVWFCEEFL